MGQSEPIGAAKALVSIDDYLAGERLADERHEYFDGRIVAMAGESGAHGDISANLLMHIASRLRGKNCRARTKDTKVLSGPLLSSGSTTRGVFSYPDIVVICGEPIYHDAAEDVILNPKAIVEVLSPSTEKFDRGLKFERCQAWNPTLADYLLVSQERMNVEHFSRNPDGSWTYVRHFAPNSAASIASIDCELKLEEIYERIVFPESNQ
jgi:Uma2 family endonuclease